MNLSPELNAMPKEANLRKCLLEIQNNPNLDAREKAQRMQELMTQGFSIKRPSSRNSEISRSHSIISKSPTVDGEDDELANLMISESDLLPSYHCEERKTLGCQHYKTKCRLRAECCGNWYVCRFCHDDAEDHQVDRFATRFIICMLCQKVQQATGECGGCYVGLAHYYCNKCKLWDDDAEKEIYHCDRCGICRRGRAEEFIHCDKCSGCLAKSHFENHKCLEGTLKSDCPICGDNLFGSTNPVRFMPCGHAIHFNCYQEHKKDSFKCPVCQKSLENVAEYFARIEQHLAAQPMPPEYVGYRAKILCNDCEKKSETDFHFMWHRCQHCRSFNTNMLSHFRGGTLAARPGAAPSVPSGDEQSDDSNSAPDPEIEAVISNNNED